MGWDLLIKRFKACNVCDLFMTVITASKDVF